jgi:hypothetical protein
MPLPHPASILGRHEFVIRRLHSLTGLMPIGGYLCFHLATNAAVLDGLDTYQRRADQMHEEPPLLNDGRLIQCDIHEVHSCFRYGFVRQTPLSIATGRGSLSLAFRSHADDRIIVR